MYGLRLFRHFGNNNYYAFVLFGIALTILHFKSDFEVELSNLSVRIENISNPEVSDMKNIVSFRIQFRKDGSCIGISRTNEPIVTFCDPQQNDDFMFVDGKIKSVKLDLCIGSDLGRSNVMVFFKCNEALNFQLDSSRLVLQDKSSGVKKCVIPDEKLGGHVNITEAGCLEDSGQIEMLEETEFLRDRAALMLPIPESSMDTCNYSACGINKVVPPVESLPNSQIERCLNLSQCVTIVTKTARRPLFVIRLAKSIRNRFNMDLPMIVIDDDGPEAYNLEVMDKIAEFPNMKYVISSPDFGIAAGRTMGLNMVKTKYFMILDDDMVVTNNTDIAKLVEMLDSTDATLVGGGSSFAGHLKFGVNDRGDPTLFHYQRSCTLPHQSVSSFPTCFNCEIIPNIFVARTQDSLKVGGWSKELKIMEHKDFFLRLKAAGKKVVYCPEFWAENVHTNKGVEFVGGLRKVFDYWKYRAKRMGRAKMMLKKFCYRWNISNVRKVKDIIPQWILDNAQ